MIASLGDVFAGYLDLRYRLDPVDGTRAGRREVDGMYGAYDDASVRAHVAALRSYAGVLEEAEAESLDDEIDQTATLHDARRLLLMLERVRPFARDPGFHLRHAMDGVLLLLGGADDDAPRSAALAARLAALPDFLRTAASALTAPVRSLTTAAVSSLPEYLDVLDAADDALAPAVAAAEDRAALVEAARTALVGFGDAMSLLDETGAVRDQAGVGREVFERLLHTGHLVQDGAEQLYRWAEAAHGDARAALAVPEATTDAETPGDRAAVRAAYEHAIDRVRALVAERDVLGDAGGTVRVVSTPAPLRGAIPSASYVGPGAFSDARTGTLYVTRALPDAALLGVVTHEVVPGRHYHTMMTNASPGLVRRALTSTASRDGWACYADQLMDEQGLFATPAAQRARAHDTVWRTARVMLDVAVHVRGMSAAAAERWFADAAGIDANLARSEVTRAIAEPTHLLAGAVGRRELLALREDARRAWTSGYTARRFHDGVLRYGAYPAALARWGMGLA